MSRAHPPAPRLRRGLSGHPPSPRTPLSIPPEGDTELTLSGRTVKLTNLHKVFWPDDGITKGDLLQYYADVAHALLPHLRDRAMVMKRYPNGARFMKKNSPAAPCGYRFITIARSRTCGSSRLATSA